MLLRIKLWLSALLFFVVALWVSWTKGAYSAQEKARSKELSNYKDTRKRIDEISDPTDADSARDWLRKHGQ